MSRKFIPLDKEVAESQTPYSIRTYKNPIEDEVQQLDYTDACCYAGREKPCKPGYVPRPKPINVEDEIFRIFKKPEIKILQKSCKKKCKRTDRFTACVMDQRSPNALKQQAVVREKYLKTKEDMERRVHDAREPSSEEESLVQLDSPKVANSKVRPKFSPGCSMDAFYVPSRKLLDLKRPRSGIFINESPREGDPEIPFETYNPRALQEKIESEKRRKYILLTDGNQLYFPWQHEMDGMANPRDDQADAFRQDCMSFRPVIFPIPDDLETTFGASVIFGSQAISNQKDTFNFRRPTEIACLYAAYVESFSKNPDYWDFKTMDTIINNGTALYTKSIETRYEDPKGDYDIIPELKDKETTVEVKLHLTGVLIDEPNILKALTLFFQKYTSCILTSSYLYLLVWKRSADSFYIFDPNGRDLQCRRDFDDGKSSLMFTKTVEHVVHVILNYSGIDERAEFNLYAIHLKDFGKLSSPLDTLGTFKPPRKLFAVVNRFYAVVPAKTGLQPPIPKATDDNPSMMTSFLGIVYNKMDPTKQWTPQLVDDLIQCGTKYHSDYKIENRLNTLNIIDLPEALLLGNYRAVVGKKPFRAAGHVVDCPSHRASQLTLAINEFLSECESGILQVDASAFGLWKERGMFFLLDAFKRDPAGRATWKPKPGAGCLQIHLNIDSLCRVVFMNAITVKTVGNFFLHEIKVKAIGTFIINKAMEGAASFRTLQIKYPLEYEPSEVVTCDNVENPLNTDALHINLVSCLSQLSVSPCERTCQEQDQEFLKQQKKIEAQKKRLTATYSIQSIPDEYKIPEFNNVDVVDYVLIEVICDAMAVIERRSRTARKYGIEASKILLKSDKAHLEDLKHRLKRGEDYDNLCVAFKTNPPDFTEMTAEEELAIPSNFTKLPDGTWAVFGTRQLDTEAEQLKGILAAITAAALSSKYGVSTWNSDVIDYALDSSEKLEERFWSFNHTLDLIFRQQIPKIQLGSTTHHIQVTQNETVEAEKLKESLNNVLLNVYRVFLVCKGLSCFIIKRYNFLYMFMGCSCDVVGFRSPTPGPMCLLRFLDMDPLVRRIETACGLCGKYVLVHLNVMDVTEPRPGKFAKRTPSQEDLLYKQELSEKERQKKAHKEKMLFIQDEIRREARRLKQFKKDKRAQARKLKKASGTTGASGSTLMEAEGGEVEEEGFNEESEDSERLFKHKPGKSLENQEEEEIPDETKAPPKLGYQLRDTDALFKIQGTTALEDRATAAVDKIKPCFFASAIAMIYAILRPLHHWDSRRIDKVITLANNIAKKTSNLVTSSERIIRNIEADEFIFAINVKTHEPLGWFGYDLAGKIMKIIPTQRYFLLQISNVTFAVYCDDYFHLFDPYNSMEILNDKGDGEEEVPDFPESVPPYPEQNTASWVLFGDVPSMLEYIEKRAASKNWKNEFKFHVVSIISYKTAPKRVQLLNLLTDEFDSCLKPPRSPNLCTHPEEIEWLDIYPNLVVWSRINRRNAVDRVRGSALTKEKNFDVEVPDKLTSLWGSIHPLSAVFGESRGKQYLAINVVACCMVNVYKLSEWNAQILDSIVINGDKYFTETKAAINRANLEISLEHLNTEFTMGHLHFDIHLESVVYGCLYKHSKNELNLAAALTYFFEKNRYGIMQCMKRSIAIGKQDSKFFMFECQSHGLPLFPAGQGASYVLRANQLQLLLYCIVMTLNLPYYNAEFTIHKVETKFEKIEEEGEEEEGEEEG